MNTPSENKTDPSQGPYEGEDKILDLSQAEPTQTAPSHENVIQLDPIAARPECPCPTDTVASPEVIRDLSQSVLDENKAEDILTIDLTGKSSIADYMIIATGSSNRHVGALADRLTQTLIEHKIKPVKVEGQKQADWVVIDAGDVIVHLFRAEVRAFYQLEKMWQDGNPLHIVG